MFRLLLEVLFLILIDLLLLMIRFKGFSSRLLCWFSGVCRLVVLVKLRNCLFDIFVVLLLLLVVLL